MLYHVPDRPRALAEIRRVLKPGGHFYATTVGATHLRELFELAQRFDTALSLWGNAVADSFLLENGGAQLERYFANLALHRYADGLVVTEAEPLVAFIASGTAGSQLSGPRRAEFLGFVAGELKANGSIFVTKDSGLFEAW
jgi:SAM-dependent methyltransferase